MRDEFRVTAGNGPQYLYPWPVMKENKYLILSKYPASFILAFKHHFLTSADSDKSYLKLEGQHSDGKTPIYSIEVDKLNFKLLGDKEEVQKINEVLNNKIKDVLLDKEKAKEALKKRFESQLNCKTCQANGILKPELKEFIYSFLT
jgi:hypothetical protein